MNKFVIKVKLYFISFIKLQLFANAVSLPFLIYWGIPISLMSIIGNLVFSPILTIFLVLSSLIFFAEILMLPNQVLINALTLITQIWEKILNMGSKSWLIGFAQPSSIVLILLVILLGLLLLRHYLRTASTALLCSAIVMGAVTVAAYKYEHSWQTEGNHKITLNDKLTITKTAPNGLTIIDNGFFARKQSPEKCVDFEIKPYLTKKYGTTPIEHFVINKPSQRCFDALIELCSTTPIKKVSMAYFDGLPNKRGWKSFFDLKRKLSEQNIELVRFTYAHTEQAPA